MVPFDMLRASKSTRPDHFYLCLRPLTTFLLSLIILLRVFRNAWKLDSREHAGSVLQEQFWTQR